MNTFVINLDNYKEKFLKQKPILENLGLNVSRFSAINAINNEHLKYKSNIHDLALEYTPNSIIGCGLSHILLAKKIKDLNLDIALIMEDDAFPLVEKEEFNNILKNTIKNISILDKDWDIIQLHSDAVFPTSETYFTHGLVGSTAAYLVSRKGAIKLSNEKVISHMDMQTSLNYNYKKYRVRKNLFWTDESASLNRIQSCNILTNIKAQILTTLIPLRGEKSWHDFLNFKLIKIQNTKDITADDILNYIIIFIFMKFILKELEKRINVKL